MLDNPNLTLGLALVAGIFCQVLARHLSMPSILLLLITGVLLGPDVANAVRPQTLGVGLSGIVSFAVAVILFEGGLSLNINRLRKEQKPIRRLVLLGPVLVTTSGALIGRFVMRFDWGTSVLFGALVIVTGPTVVNPLLKRMNVRHRLRAILEAEGVLSDAVGAVVAVVVLDIVLRPSVSSIARGGFEILTSLGFGLLLGGISGLILALLLRPRELVPEQLRNVVVLCVVFAIFQLAESLVHESGIATATMAGAVVGNMKNRGAYHLAEFKEQLTAMLIGLLFVLLSADVRLAHVLGLGWPAVWAVALLILVVRPVHAFISTVGSELSFRERTFIAAIAPRGIVAAAVASLFAVRLAEAEVGGGQQLRALVFLVIATTVVLAAVLGPTLASILGLRRAANQGWLIVGADAVGRVVGKALHAAGDDSLLLDLDAEACETAEREGLRTLQGNALREEVLREAEIDIRRGAIAAARKDAINLLFLQRARRLGDIDPLYVSLTPDREAANLEILDELGGHVLFGRSLNHELWVKRISSQGARLQRLRATRKLSPEQLRPPDELVLFVVTRHKGKAWPFSGITHLRRGTEVWLLLAPEQEAEARTWLTARGFEGQVDAQV